MKLKRKSTSALNISILCCGGQNLVFIHCLVTCITQNIFFISIYVIEDNFVFVTWGRNELGVSHIYFKSIALAKQTHLMQY